MVQCYGLGISGNEKEMDRSGYSHYKSPDRVGVCCIRITPKWNEWNSLLTKIILDLKKKIINFTFNFLTI